MVMLALMLVLLLAFAGYSVDVGNWNVQRNEVRTAAEAAALGGVSFLPDDPTTARLTALRLAAHHGYGADDVTVEVGDAPNQLRVTIEHEFDNYFVRVIGLMTKTVTETAVAEFEQPVDMGSPEFVLGNDPDTGARPDFWLSIAGDDVDKALGDRFATRSCSAGTGACAAGTNVEWSPAGYTYAVRVTDTSQPLRIQAFDPAWVWTGSSCNIPNWPTAAEIAILQAEALTSPLIPDDWYDDAATRLAGGPGEFCTGDDRPGASGPATTFQVRLPDDSPWDDLDNPVVNTGSCKPTTFPAYEPTSIYQAPTESIFELLEPGGGNDWQVQDNGTVTFAEVFRRWYTICELSPGPWLREGDYIVQVSTDGGPGQNRFALRAGPPTADGGVSDVGQSLFSRGRMPVFVNSSDADTRFFLARVPPSSEDRVLRVSFFDIGDASAPGTLSIVPGADSTLTAFTNCTFTMNDVPLPSTNCALTNVWDANGFDGQIVQVDVTIPGISHPTTPYDCDETLPGRCWVSIRAQFAGGITDATTWTAELIGDAVRIIPE